MLSGGHLQRLFCLNGVFIVIHLGCSGVYFWSICGLFCDSIRGPIILSMTPRGPVNRALLKVTGSGAAGQVCGSRLGGPL